MAGGFDTLKLFLAVTILMRNARVRASKQNKQFSIVKFLVLCSSNTEFYEKSLIQSRAPAKKTRINAKALFQTTIVANLLMIRVE